MGVISSSGCMWFKKPVFYKPVVHNNENNMMVTSPLRQQWLRHELKIFIPQPSKKQRLRGRPTTPVMVVPRRKQHVLLHIDIPTSPLNNPPSTTTTTSSNSATKVTQVSRYTYRCKICCRKFKTDINARQHFFCFPRRRRRKRIKQTKKIRSF